MADRPILFSASMVRAILAGTKTQTRRAMKNPPEWRTDHHPHGWQWNGKKPGEPVLSKWPDAKLIGQEIAQRATCPYGKPGDRLWVREAFRFPESIDHLSPAEIGEKALAVGYPKPWCPIQFEADGLRRTPQEWRDFVTPPQANEAGRLRAGMHMPRWASRITLEVTGVRVERLQDISEADAIAEGLIFDDKRPEWGCWYVDESAKRGTDYPVEAYRALWEQINGPESWSANPWVWVVEFKRLEAASSTEAQAMRAAA